ncbi:MAG TPA: TldD/PmbA family protein [Gemmatimonadaceae bacterium]|nr:TldD/PmbA family protein [Gemmatimonadaceae bacterium]
MSAAVATHRVRPLQWLEGLAHDPLSVEGLLAVALDAIRAGGAQFADVRIQRLRGRNIRTREHQLIGVGESDSIGCGVRALVDGTWGFAATRVLTDDGVAATARQAIATAKASRAARGTAIELAPAPAHRAQWSSPCQIDPFDVTPEEEIDLLLRANAAALATRKVQFASSGLDFVKEERHYASTDGAMITQTVIRSGPMLDMTAVSTDRTAFQPLSVPLAPMGRGWEYVEERDLVRQAPEWAEHAAAKLGAKSVEIGRYDLILHPSNLWLTIHESIGHATELDRVLGYEANLAGTSFVAPPEKMLGALRYGPPTMNVRADRSQPGGLSTIGYDDDGVAPDDFLLIKDGILDDYQTTRDQAQWLRWWYDKTGRPTHSHGCSYAQDWANVQFQRMPNVSLLPGERDLMWEDLIAATDRGIAIIGDGSYSIDHQRYNGQFSGQLFYEIKGGKIVGMLRDVAYQFRTLDFWNSLRMLGGPRSYELRGTFSDGKGEPIQTNAVSHGSVPAVFAQVNVINTGRRA